jgi:biopolymer transport protein ExbD
MLPETNKQELKIAESKMITIRVSNDMVIYWNKGFDVPQKMAFDKFADFCAERRKERADWIWKIIVDREAKSRALIDIVDELKSREMDKFSIVPITEIDKKEMARAAI